MFIVSNLSLSNFSIKIQNYYIDFTGAHLVSNEDFVFLFEGYLYPDIEHDLNDLISFFESFDKPDSFTMFKGKYSGIFINLSNDNIYFFNDQLGSRDIYYYNSGENFIISNSFSAILFRRRFLFDDIDIDAINEFLIFEYPLSDRTFIKNIKLLPMASIYSLTNRKLSRFNYWKYKFQVNADFNEIDALDKLDTLLSNSLSRIASINPSRIFGLGLSGGRDSRLVAYYANKLNLNLLTFIFGEPNSDAYQISDKIAKKLNLEHHQLGVNYNFIKHSCDSIEFNPMISILYTWYYSVYDLLPQFDLLLTGYLGGELFGSHITKSDYYTNDLAAVLYMRFNQSNISINRNKMLYGLEQVIKNFDNDSIVNQIMEFDYKQRQLKFIKFIPALNFLGKFESFSIFEDIDLISFLLGIPYKWKADLRLYKLFLSRKLSMLSSVRVEREYKFNNKLLLNFEKILKMIDINIVKSEFFYKKPHKNLKKWLKGNIFFYEYCKNILSVKNDFYDHHFNYIDMKEELNLIVKGNCNQERLFFRILTIKLWLNSFL